LTKKSVGYNNMLEPAILCWTHCILDICLVVYQ